jgi:hypothetical protein
MDIEALAIDISDVSDFTSIESDSLLRFILIISDNSVVAIVSVVVAAQFLDGDDVVSIGVGSHGLGSPVEHEPLLVVLWLGVLDSESVVVFSNVFMPEEGSVRGHSGLDLEPDSVLQWVSWEWSSSSVDEPSLVGGVLGASVPSEVSIVGILLSGNV